ncbi:MAG: hypothetical protein H6513_15895 [Acidimicrobiaceae bacterium]|nr:hypothetical protein [Ilumatobacter sp.]MCB0981288.1 hypothetical protein [Ilumatobacter sp.]MCB9382167.1 hypothetical protein [Acidimicrobiaceae bacterium]MCO5330921.1 hypothetical protein [Ilumatobacteraceae bacterium]
MRAHLRPLIAAALTTGLIAGGLVANSPAPAAASVSSGSVTELQITGQNGVPSNATAAMVNLTALRGVSRGWLTLYPCGEAIPLASNLNFEPDEPARTNAAISRIGSGGKVCIYSSTRVELVVDLTGYTQPNSGVNAITPSRLVDTREGTGGLYRMSSNSTVTVQVAGAGGVPGTATSAALNVTATAASGSGAFTVYPCDAARPSNAQVAFSADRPVPNLVITALSASGTVCVHTTRATELVIDVDAWMDNSAGFTDAPNTRLLNATVSAGSTRVIDPGSAGSGEGSLVLTLTSGSPATRGYLTVYPCGTSMPLSSNGNPVPGFTTTNSMVAKPGSDGTVCVFSSVSVALAVDLAGTFPVGGVRPIVPVRLFDSRELFPTAQTAGVPSGTSLRSWPWALRTSAASGVPTEYRNGMACQVFDGYLVSLSGSQTLAVDTTCAIFRNSRFRTTGDTQAIVIGTRSASFIEVWRSDFDGGPSNVRGIQSDYATMAILESEFAHFGNAAVEMNDRNQTATLTVEDCYMYQAKGWPREQHADGVQMSAGGGIFVRNNTILMELFGGSNGDYSYVSNSAVGIGTSLGRIGTVVIDHNRLAGGGYVVYVERKSYPFTGTVTITNNNFDLMFSPNSGIWGPLFPNDVPSGVEWSGNSYNMVYPISLQYALSL